MKSKLTMGTRRNIKQEAIDAQLRVLRDQQTAANREIGRLKRLIAFSQFSSAVRMLIKMDRKLVTMKSTEFAREYSAIQGLLHEASGVIINNLEHPTTLIQKFPKNRKA